MATVSHTFVLSHVIVYTDVIIVQCISMNCVRSTFCVGRSRCGVTKFRQF